MIAIPLDEVALADVARKTAESVIRDRIMNGTEVKDAVTKAVNSVKIDSAYIQAVVEKAVKEVIEHPGFLHDLIRTSLLKSAPKLEGSFDASLRAAGKRLAMPSDVIEKIAEGVAAKAMIEAEERMAEYELRGGGSFT